MEVLPHHRKLVAEVIRELLDTRYFLALQLEHASGFTSEEEFQKRAQPHFHRLENPIPNARDRALTLFEVADLDVDGEELSVLLRCTIETANEILR